MEPDPVRSDLDRRTDRPASVADAWRRLVESHPDVEAVLEEVGRTAKARPAARAPRWRYGLEILSFEL